MNSSYTSPIVRRHLIGSMTLQLLFSLFFGVVFSLLFLNLTQYVTAMNVVERAARDISRCLAPTDGDCRVHRTEADRDQRFEWFRGEFRGRTRRKVQLYDYRGAAELQHWRATVNQYEIKKGFKTVRWPVAEVPIVRYRASPIREYRFGTFQRSVQSRTGFYLADTFPEWNENAERELENRSSRAWKLDLSDNSVTNQRTSSFDSSRFINALKQRSLIRSGTTLAFESGPIEVPELELPSAECRKGHSCSVDIQAGAKGNSSDFRSTAHIAIKVFAHVRSSDPKRPTQVRWGQRFKSGGGPGLQLEAEGYPDRPLGGRSTSGPIDHGGEWFNLWLRGPLRSHGGDPTETHDNLRVTRGRTFNIRGWLSTDPSSADASAEITILYFIDTPQYNPGNIIVRDCPEIPLLPGAAQALCPDRITCGLPTGTDYVDLSCNLLTLRRIPTCHLEDQRTFPLSDLSLPTLDEYHFDCSPHTNTIVPTPRLMNLTLPADLQQLDLYCGGFRRDDQFQGRYRLVGKVTECPRATTLNLTARCSPSSAPETVSCDDDNTTPFICSRSTHILSESKAQVLTLSSFQGENESSPIGSLKAAPLASADLIAGEIEQAPPYMSWSAVDDHGIPVPCATPLRRSIDNIAPIYKHRDPTWMPTLAYFSQVTPQDGALLNQIAPSFSFISSEPFPFNSVYPFARLPEYEIPRRIPLDSSCEGDGATTDPLELRLRHYAAAQLPEILDTTLAFAFSATPHGSREFNVSPSCGSDPGSFYSEIRNCTPFTELAAPQQLCNTGESIGIFSARDYPFGPPECTHNGESICFKRSVDSPDTDRESFATERIDAARATAVGLAAVRRAFPQAEPNCFTAGCAQIAITADNAENNNLSGPTIQVDYRLPIYFPLSTFVQRDSLTVRFTKEELRESDGIFAK